MFTSVVFHQHVFFEQLSFSASGHRFGLDLLEVNDVTKQKAQDGMPIEMVYDYVLHGAASVLEKLHNNLGCCETDIYDAFDILLINLLGLTKKAFANEPIKQKAILAKQQSDKFRYYIPLNPKWQTP